MLSLRPRASLISLGQHLPVLSHIQIILAFAIGGFRIRNSESITVSFQIDENLKLWNYVNMLNSNYKHLGLLTIQERIIVK